MDLVPSRSGGIHPLINLRSVHCNGINRNQGAGSAPARANKDERKIDRPAGLVKQKPLCHQ